MFKKLGLVFVAVVMVFAPLMLLASEVIPVSGDEVLAWLQSAIQLKGASTIIIGSVVVQGLMLTLRSTLGEKAGIWRLVALSGLSLIYSALTIYDPSQSFLANLGVIASNAQALAALNVFYHSVLTRIGSKEEAPQV